MNKKNFFFFMLTCAFVSTHVLHGAQHSEKIDHLQISLLTKLYSRYNQEDQNFYNNVLFDLLTLMDRTLNKHDAPKNKIAIPVAQYILEERAKDSRNNQQRDNRNYGVALLNMAVLQNNLRMVKLLVTDGGINPDPTTLNLAREKSPDCHSYFTGEECVGMLDLRWWAQENIPPTKT